MTLDRGLVAAALPGYEVGEELGRGAFGIVLGGRHRQLHREVAIKQLPRAFGADPDIRSRFLTEARLLASLDHPHIVPVYDFVEHEGLCLLVMERLPGGTLWDRFRGAGLAPQQTCAVVIAALVGLHHAHEHGVLHRDVKPENLLFSADGTPKVADFGIAKMVGGGRTMATRAGAVVGTPVYMAPEQARGVEIGPQADVYAAGTVLYELLTGRLPFPESDDVVAILMQRATEAPAPIASVAPQIPAPIADVTMRAIATDPADRHPNAEAFAEAVAGAAAAAWGPGWLPSSGVPVLGSSRVAAAAERAASVSDLPVTPGGLRPPGPPAHTATQTVKPVAGSHAKGANIADASASELVPVTALTAPSRPWPQRIAAIALLCAAVVVAFIGGRAPTGSGDLTGAVAIAGADPRGDRPVALDLREPVAVALRGGPSGATTVRLSWSAAGVPLGSTEAPLQGDGDTRRATVDASTARFLVTSPVRGHLALTADGRELGRVSFPATVRPRTLLTAPMGALVLMVLFCAAYAESLLRTMRRGGRLRPSGFAGLAVIGALLGVAAVDGAWVAGAAEPTSLAVVLCALLGAAAGLCFGWASARTGRRRVVRRTIAAQTAVQPGVRGPGTSI